MATLKDIREGIADALQAGLDGFKVSPYLMGNPTPPAIEVQPSETEYDLALNRGWDRWQLTVRAMVPLTSDRGSQIKLDELIAASGGSSVKQLLEADRTLGGVCDDLRVVRCTGYRSFGSNDGRPSLLGAEWQIEVFATGG